MNKKLWALMLLLPLLAFCGKKDKPEPDPDFKRIDPSVIQPVENWAGLVEEISRRNPAISGFLRKSKAFVGGDTAFIIVDNDFFFQQFKRHVRLLVACNARTTSSNWR